jgi:multiple sugar transport system substrate-binding protein
MFRITRALVVSTAAALSLSSCSGGTTSEDSAPATDQNAIAQVTDEQLKGVTLQLARFFGDCEDTVGTSTDLSKAVGECPTIQTLTNKFNAENKWGIKVERLGGAAWESYYDQLNAAFAGGNPPNVAIMHGSSLVDYAQRGLLIPAEDLIAATKTDLGDAVPAAKIAIAYEDKNYAVPFDIHAGLAHVNIDLFKKAGLTNPDGTAKLPTSADEFFSQAKTMKDKTGKNYLSIARVGDALGVLMFESLLNQQGGGVLNSDNTAAAIDTPEARTALTLMNEMFSEGYANGKQSYDAAQQSFLTGDSALLFNGTWVIDQYVEDAKFDYAAANFPTLYTQPGVWSDAHTWVVPKQSGDDPVKYRAAIEFINFLYEHDRDWALGTGHIAARTSVINSPEYKAAPQRANYADTGLKIAHPVPHVANWPAVSKALVATIESIWFQGTDMDKALKDGSAKINSALQGA